MIRHSVAKLASNAPIRGRITKGTCIDGMCSRFSFLAKAAMTVVANATIVPTVFTTNGVTRSSPNHNQAREDRRFAFSSFFWTQGQTRGLALVRLSRAAVFRPSRLSFPWVAAARTSRSNEIVCRPVSRDRTDHTIGRASSWADLDPSARSFRPTFSNAIEPSHTVALFALGIDEASLRGLMRD